MIPPSTNIAAAYSSASGAGQELVLYLALFLSNFLSTYLRAVKTEVNRDVLLNAHLYMVKISQVDECKIFKITLEYWSKLMAELYDEIQALPIGKSRLLIGLSLGSSGGNMLNGMSLRKNTYSNILSNLRLVVIKQMVKPEEMQELLVYLTHLDIVDTKNILTKKLAKQNLNMLCWAIGSISAAMNEETKKHCPVTIIKDLLGLCEIIRGKDNKAVTVVNKLFEFMHETHEGVQDMVCDTFIKIAQKCRRHFVMQQSEEQEPFVDEIL
ncbi:hypothetical protein BDR07DRAFT_1522427 [Suillus spraguei]|nr:hypothetical protein BDR07DRAFT_1522427 [Suillus spraguei]